MTRAAALRHDVPRGRADRASGRRTSTPPTRPPTTRDSDRADRPTTGGRLGARRRDASRATKRGRSSRRRSGSRSSCCCGADGRLRGGAARGARTGAVAAVGAGRVSREQQGDASARGSSRAGSSSRRIRRWDIRGWRGMQVWEGLVRLTGPALPWIACVSAIADLSWTFVRDRGSQRAGLRSSAAGARRVRGAAPLRVLQGAPGAHPLRRAAGGRGRGDHGRWRRPAAAPRAAGRRRRSSSRSRPGRRRRSTPGRRRSSWNHSARRRNSAGRTRRDRLPRVALGRPADHDEHGIARATTCTTCPRGFGDRGLPARGQRRDLEIRRATSAAVRRVDRDEERAEGGDELSWQGRHDPRFFADIERVAEGGGVALYRRRRRLSPGDEVRTGTRK